MISTIIYDLDGTIVFSEPIGVKALIKTLHELNISHANFDLNILIFRPISDLLKLIFKNNEHMIHDARIAWFNNYIQLAFEKGMLKLAPDIKETLEKLKNEGYKLAIGTGSVYALVDLTLEYFELKQYFDEIVTVEEVESPKPAPDTFNLIAKNLKVESNECIVVGDTKYDIIAAKEFGATAVLYDSPITPHKIKYGNTHTPDFIIKKHPELLKILELLDRKNNDYPVIQ